MEAISEPQMNGCGLLTQCRERHVGLTGYPGDGKGAVHQAGGSVG